MIPSPQAPELAELRRRTSEKWTTYPDDVLPMFVAEMDYRLAPVIVEALTEQIRIGDVGYVGGARSLAPAFAGFAGRRWGWEVDPADVRVAADVSVVIVEALRAALAPGDSVIVNSPVYPPFYDLVIEAGGRVVDVPLLDDDGDVDRRSGRLDLAGIEVALRAGARVVLLCHPQNPLGHLHTRSELTELAELAHRHSALVVSDEIHAPLCFDSKSFVPFLSIGPTAREVGIAAHSASKAFNLAGAKCAVMVTSSARTRAVLDQLPEEVTFRTSILGRTASTAAFTAGDEWLDATLTGLAGNANLLDRLLADQLPDVGWTRPAASYLAWLDFRRTDLGDDPATRLLQDARVALQPGPPFGPGGRGHARLNFACSPAVLTDAVARIAAAI